jgi:hypothetical protein
MIYPADGSCRTGAERQIVNNPPIGRGIKVDLESRAYDAAGNVIREFPPAARTDGFSDLVDNYVAQAQKFSLGKGIRGNRDEPNYCYMAMR